MGTIYKTGRKSKLMSKKNCLIIFTRKPEKGKVKTRLAQGVGDDKALKVYIYLLKHSAKITANVNAHQQVWYTNSIERNDIWNDGIFEKLVQCEGDLGNKMQFAFEENFKKGFNKVIIIGTDLLDINSEDIEKAFQLLDKHEVVIGPAEDGGYYLLGMKSIIPELFLNIDWSTEHVLEQTLDCLTNKTFALLDQRNDIDYKDDALRHAELKKIIEN